MEDSVLMHFCLGYFPIIEIRCNLSSVCCIGSVTGVLMVLKDALGQFLTTVNSSKRWNCHLQRWPFRMFSCLLVLSGKKNGSAATSNYVKCLFPVDETRVGAETSA